MLSCILIDDEPLALEELSYLLRECQCEVVGTFTDGVHALTSVEKLRPDVVFLDINMPGVNGIDLGVNLRSRRDDLNIVYVTAHTRYAVESFIAYPTDYILKPVDGDRLAKTIRKIENSRPGREAERGMPEPPIRCFGTFAIQGGDGSALRFPTRKTRDLLACLICFHDRHMTRAELLDAVFPGPDPKRALNNLYVTFHRLRGLLAQAGIPKEALVIRDDYSLQIADGTCDYVDVYRFLRANPAISPSNAETARRMVERIRGGLLTDIDSDWAVETRQWFTVRCEELMLKTAAHETAHGSPMLATQILTRLIEQNRFSEPAYQALMDLHILLKDDSGFRLVYQAYCRMLNEELDLQPERKYVEHARKTQG